MNQTDRLVELLAEEAPASDLKIELHGPYVKVEGTEVPLIIQLAQVGKRTVCSGLVLGWGDEPTEITTRMLHDLRIRELVKTLIASINLDELGEPLQVEVVPRRKWDADEIRDLYEQAKHESPKAPVKWLQKRLSISRATAHRWLSTL